MSTSSSYSSNKLRQVLTNGTQHFIIKSYVSTAFEYDRKVPEYHLYWVNLNKALLEDMEMYQRLSCKHMNKKELKYFNAIIDQYDIKVSGEDGIVWENKKLGLNKDLVRNQSYEKDIISSL